MSKGKYFMSSEEIEHLSAYKKGRLAFNKVVTASQKEIFIFSIPRECVENKDARFLEAVLTFAIQNNLRNQIQLTFDSYADDGRDISEIPEVVEYIQGLNEVFPAWSYFMSVELDFSSLSILLEMLVVYRKALQNGSLELITVNNEELMEMAEECIGGIDRLLTLNYPHSIITRDVILAKAEIRNYINSVVFQDE